MAMAEMTISSQTRNESLIPVECSSTKGFPGRLCCVFHEAPELWLAKSPETENGAPSQSSCEESKNHTGPVTQVLSRCLLTLLH